MRFIYFIFIISLSCSVTSQVSDTIDLSKINRYFRFDYDNDFFNATDRYYTQGASLELIAPALGKSPFSKILFRLKKQSQNYHGIGISQECFTPGSIRYDTLNYLDRPYAGAMYLSQSLTSIQPLRNRRLSSRIDLGVMGPCSLCEWGQKAIHEELGYIPPLGWENQVAFDVIVNYMLKFEQGFYAKKHFELTGIGIGRLGTMYTDASVGLLVRAGKIPGYFRQFGPIKKPIKTKFTYYVYCEGLARLVGYNAMMQGGLFSKDIMALPYTSVTKIVYTGMIGAVFGYKFFTLEATRVFISPEFKNGYYHGWGHIAFQVYF